MIALIISGRVGNDAKELENGCVFNIASTKKGFTSKSGSVIPDKTVWFSVFAHKNLAPYIKKGDSITVYTDDLNTYVYEGKCNLSCNALNIEFGGKSSGNTSTTEPQQSAPTQSSSTQNPQIPDDGDDLPF